MLIEISERVEEMADTLFTTVQENHQKLADNYLSLKAYAVTAEDKLTDYVTKGKGKNLSSLGDLLSNVALLADVKVEKEEGIGMGSAELPAIFTGNAIKVDKSVSKINALVNEYSKVTHQVRLRWHVGLGKYLLCKLEESMMQGSPASGHYPGQEWQLRVHERSCCWPVQQAQRLRESRSTHCSLR